MKVNYTVVVISAIITAVTVSTFLKLAGNPMGIPETWNPALSGGIAAGISSILGQKYAKTPEENDS